MVLIYSIDEWFGLRKVSSGCSAVPNISNTYPKEKFVWGLGYGIDVWRNSCREGRVMMVMRGDMVCYLLRWLPKRIFEGMMAAYTSPVKISGWVGKWVEGSTGEIFVLQKERTRIRIRLPALNEER